MKWNEILNTLQKHLKETFVLALLISLTKIKQLLLMIILIPRSGFSKNLFQSWWNSDFLWLLVLPLATSFLKIAFKFLMLFRRYEGLFFLRIQYNFLTTLSYLYSSLLFKKGKYQSLFLYFCGYVKNICKIYE